MPECPHGGDPHCCPPCQNTGGDTRTQTRHATAVLYVIEAAFTSWCRACGFDIQVGARIAKVKDGRATWWVHETCAEGAVDG